MALVANALLVIAIAIPKLKFQMSALAVLAIVDQIATVVQATKFQTVDAAVELRALVLPVNVTGMK